MAFLRFWPVDEHGEPCGPVVEAAGVTLTTWDDDGEPVAYLTVDVDANGRYVTARAVDELAEDPSFCRDHRRR